MVTAGGAQPRATAGGAQPNPQQEFEFKLYNIEKNNYFNNYKKKIFSQNKFDVYACLNDFLTILDTISIILTTTSPYLNLLSSILKNINNQNYI